MRLLLDTHVLVWFLEDNPALGRASRNLIGNPENIVSVSIVSAWELIIKTRSGKFNISPDQIFGSIAAYKFGIIPFGQVAA